MALNIDSPVAELAAKLRVVVAQTLDAADAEGSPCSLRTLLFDLALLVPERVAIPRPIIAATSCQLLSLAQSEQLEA